MTKRDAIAMGIPYLCGAGWLGQYGSIELSRDQVKKMICDLAVSAKAKTAEHQVIIKSRQLSRLTKEWPDLSVDLEVLLPKEQPKKSRSKKTKGRSAQNLRIMADLERELGRPLSANVEQVVFVAKQKTQTKKPYLYDGFYETREWRELRYKALVLNGAVCQCCGATRNDGIKLHVDHIKPRSKFPHLQLDLTNLQILCEDCNLGKSNKDCTDWR